VLAGCALPTKRTGVASKRLIAFSGGEPDTDFLRRHAAQMEAAPFDGCVFRAAYVRPDGRLGELAWEAWGGLPISPASLSSARADLLATRFRRFTHNFLRLNVTPGDLDWFDDFAPLLANVRTATRLAGEGGAAGILLDTEAYAAPLFDYRRQRRAGGVPWIGYAGQARQRGQEIMAAMQEGFPGLTLLMTFGYSGPWLEMARRGIPLAECEYGLLPAMLDGMLDVASGRTRLVDGFEPAYFHDKDTTKFRGAFRMIREELLSIVADPIRYRERVSVGFGLFVDYDPEGRAWNGLDGSRNYYTPADFEASVRAALDAADEFVWIYADAPRWFSAAGRPVKLPAGYLEALHRARVPR